MNFCHLNMIDLIMSHGIHGRFAYFPTYSASIYDLTNWISVLVDDDGGRASLSRFHYVIFYKVVSRCLDYIYIYTYIYIFALITVKRI